ncbi:terminase [Streptomyces sp. K1PN6]|uniref:Terminase n=1 Tax=Streptomyces acidicola TaxID=2596892 RepID=A0A5N8WI77_9ACTN|nr:terminase [Streptomyces acidicola]MPY47292.1 terminase [Streptomyces acidicola]
MEWEPKLIGPTWQRDSGGSWRLPEATLGWEVLGWCGVWLQHSRGVPWRFTDEQARFLLWWFALDEAGTFAYRDGVLQRLKGWGKDPLGACLCAVEALGPSRFVDWAADGTPIATDSPEAWVQTAAVSLEQTKNTMRLFPSLFTAEAKEHYRIQVGKETVNALGDSRLIQAVTSSPSTLEGARATFVLLNETHHWDSSNSGHDMADVIERNATKSADGAARTLRITNAYEPGQDSVAERDRDAWEAVDAGRVMDSGLLYDSIEAPPKAPLTVEDAPAVIRSIRGDAAWLNVDRIVKSIADVRNPPSRSRRFWYNMIVAAEDAWMAPYEWDACKAVGLEVRDGEEVVMFFDGSKSDDATALAGCRMSDGHVFTLGVWQRPANWDPDLPWSVPRDEADGVVERAFNTYKVLAFFCDPGSGKDDDGERYWYAYLDKWGQEHGSKLILHAVTAGPKQHAVRWDMGAPRHQEEFTDAVKRTGEDILERRLTHDGHKVMRTHVANSRRRTNAWGITIGKEHRESARKIDLAVCMIGARMLRRKLLNSKQYGKRPKSRGKGRVVVLR